MKTFDQLFKCFCYFVFMNNFVNFLICNCFSQNEIFKLGKIVIYLILTKHNMKGLYPKIASTFVFIILYLLQYVYYFYKLIGLKIY